MLENTQYQNQMIRPVPPRRRRNEAVPRCSPLSDFLFDGVRGVMHTDANCSAVTAPRGRMGTTQSPRRAVRLAPRGRPRCSVRGCAPEAEAAGTHTAHLAALTPPSSALRRPNCSLLGSRGRGRQTSFGDDGGGESHVDPLRAAQQVAGRPLRFTDSLDAPRSGHELAKYRLGLHPRELCPQA
jgi:hypothetical protein